MKTRVWVAILAAIACVCAALMFFTRRAPSPTVGVSAEGVPAAPLTVAVYSEGVCVRRIDLNSVTQEERFVVESADGGANVVLVEPGRICVESADCPDQVCVMEGWLPDFGLPIVCLPHNLIIIEEDAP